MDRVAYTSRGTAYVVHDGVIDEASRRVLVSNFKSDGMTDPQISSRIEEIENSVMDSIIAKIHSDPQVRKVAKRQDLSLEDKNEIYEMTQGGNLLANMSGDYFMPAHKGIVNANTFGLHVITLRSVINQGIVDRRVG